MYAEAGDTLAVNVINNINTSMSIHFHGLQQRKSVVADGASGISNKALEPYETRVVVSNIGAEDVGTRFYHAHYGLYDQQIYGALIITSPQDKQLLKYDEDRVLVLSDYWRQTPESLIPGLLTDPVFKWIGSPASFLTNGKTIGENCTAEGEYDVTEVEVGKTYRIRIIAASTLFYVNFVIPGHKMTLVEVEGTLIEPIEVDHVELASGQRYSVLITADQAISTYWMQQHGRWRGQGPKNGFAKLQYKDADIYNYFSPKYPVAVTSPNESAQWITNQFKPLNPVSIPASNKQLVLAGRQVTYTDQRLRWTVNDVSYVIPEASPVIDYVLATTLDVIPKESAPYTYNYGDVVDIIFQNYVVLNGICETHPWHLHGHSFWVMASGSGLYNASVPDYEHPIERDTVTLYPSSNSYIQPKGAYNEPCGWTKIRYVANNPGICD
jgi:L-ascorbate oxidase